ncbi:MAG: hypothetical protein Q8K58_13965, partial [Acidimicrobiales bacterium]|nr:hypothetical protein [Acidimicrobiales bacterium]
MTDAGSASDPTGPPPTTLRYRVLVALAVLAAIGALAAAVMRTDTGEDEPATVAGRPDVVEHLIPPSGTEFLRQSELGIDLAPGYEGALAVNGTEIPEDQLRLVPQQNQVFFTPGAGKVIEELRAGPACVIAVVWKT